MKFFLNVPFLLLALAAAGSAPAVAQSQGSASETPRVGRNMIANAEKSIDNRFTRLWDDNAFVVLGPTRGVYLEGYGAVFTVEVNLVAGPIIGIMTPPRTKDDIAQHKQKKIARVPELKKALQQALADLSASPEMAAVPPDQQIVLVAFLSHYPWEDLSGLPAEIMMQGTKQKLTEALHAGGASLAAAIQAAQF
jgi:hypothetical protein